MTTVQEVRSPHFLPTSRCIAASLLAVIPAFGVLPGCYSHSDPLVPIHPAFLPTQYNAAPGFIPCSPGLTSTLSGRAAGSTARSPHQLHPVRGVSL